jgi:hypothetical protein
MLSYSRCLVTATNYDRSELPARKCIHQRRHGYELLAELVIIGYNLVSLASTNFLLVKDCQIKSKLSYDRRPVGQSLLALGTIWDSQYVFPFRGHYV